MNYIVSAYLTTSIDCMRGIQLKANDPNYIKDWYDSVVKLKLNGIILHDSLDDDFIKQFPGVKFLKVAPIPEWMQLYDYRWVVYFLFLSEYNCDYIFFTDISDVVVASDPFQDIKEGLYCGDEQTTLKDCQWLQGALDVKEYSKELKLFKEVLSQNSTLFNAGILGGSYKDVLDFLKILYSKLEKLSLRQVHYTVDMPLFNYVMYLYFEPKHGFPINSKFKSYEKRDDVWFIHK